MTDGTSQRRRESPSEIVRDFLENPIVQDGPVLSDAIRVSRYVEDGGEIVDLTNRAKERE